MLIASNVAELHSDKANINNDTALDEQGRQINPQGAPNRHDILTGSTPDGRATPQTCQNWTSSAGDQSAMLGHHDRLTFGKPGSPWNAAHPSKGCSQENLVATGGAGRLLLRGELVHGGGEGASPPSPSPSPFVRRHRLGCAPRRSRREREQHVAGHARRSACSRSSRTPSRSTTTGARTVDRAAAGLHAVDGLVFAARCRSPRSPRRSARDRRAGARRAIRRTRRPESPSAAADCAGLQLGAASRTAAASACHARDAVGDAQRGQPAAGRWDRACAPSPSASTTASDVAANTRSPSLAMPHCTPPLMPPCADARLPDDLAVLVRDRTPTRCPTSARRAAGRGRPP